MKIVLAEKILRETEEGYDLISRKFSQTRNRFWRGLEFIAKFSKDNDTVLDFGCGNGRLLEILLAKNIDYIGLDVSEKLINLAQKRKDELSVTQSTQFLKIENNFKKIPFPSEKFDTIYSIAVFHHLPSKKIRLAVASELYRLLKKDGFIIVTVWDLWQARYRKNIFKNWKDKIFKKSELDFNDCWVSFTDNEGQKFNRFHHAFTKINLKRLFNRSGFEILECRRINGNIVLVAKK